MEKKKIIKLALIAAVVLIAGLGVMKAIGSFSATGNAVKDTEQVKEFNVKAFRFGYTPNEIEVKKGDKVRIKVENSDTIHGMRIQELGVSGNDVIEFTADKEGTFTWNCNNMCGKGHTEMSGKLIVK